MKIDQKRHYRPDKNLVMRVASKTSIHFLSLRFYFLLFILLLLTGALIARMVYLTVFDRTFLEAQGNARILRTVKVPAHRGMILDRNGEPLAVSTAVDSVWVNPKDFPNTFRNIKKISHLLHVKSSRLRALLRHNVKKQFVYFKRDINPETSKLIRQLPIPGIYLQREFRRYYPEGEVATHVVGFTNIDDQGVEGLELAYNLWLKGQAGKKRVLKDRYGHIVAELAQISAAKSGNNLILSLDNRIQFLAYQVLKATVKKFHAESGSVVVLNPKTGEVLAMVNQPSYNPNRKPSYHKSYFRNRAVTDVFEPGSTLKAFSVASALDSGAFSPESIINTSPGWFRVGHNLIRDEHDHGVISITEILQKSSNIGVAKMTLSLPPEHLIDLLQRVGFGERTGSGFPGESAGSLVNHTKWRPFVLATLAFGYGISVTPLQLTHAYAVIANNGNKCPITFIKRENPVKCVRVMSSKNAGAMLKMLEAVIQKGGTGTRARIANYSIAGKTGTSYIAGVHGYDQSKHMSSFVGMAPASHPRLVVFVVIRNPKGKYYGAVVAAPAFAKIMGGALRILNIPPDLWTRKL